MKDNIQPSQLSDDEMRFLENEVMANKSNLILSVDMKKFVGVDKKDMDIGLEPIKSDDNALF